MANRVIKDTIWVSKTLSNLPPYYQDQWPRWLLMADDWGCFNADPDVIKGTAYPKRRESAKKIEKIRTAFNEAGLLFVWKDEKDREWGYFVSWESHQFCNASTVDGSGKYTKHRRKTPEPPKDQLNQYLFQFSDIVRQGSTKSLNPNPNPNPNPKPKHNPNKQPSAAEAALKKIYEDGFNIYKCLYRLKKELGFSKDRQFPDPVVIKVCEQYFKDKDKIQKPWPWFIKVFAAESEKYHVRMNIEQNDKSKESLNKDINALIQKLAAKCAVE